MPKTTETDASDPRSWSMHAQEARPCEPETMMARGCASQNWGSLLCEPEAKPHLQGLTRRQHDAAAAEGLRGGRMENARGPPLWPRLPKV